MKTRQRAGESETERRGGKAVHGGNREKAHSERGEAEVVSVACRQLIECQ